jgi:hypothetical protein
MTTTELKKKIAQSESKDWFKEKSQNFNFSYINFNSDIMGVSSIYEFANQQINGWQSLEKNLPEELQNSLNYFTQIRNSISAFVVNYATQSSNDLNNYWHPITAAINNVRQHPLTYNCPESEFLVTVHKNYPGSILGAFNFITSQLNSSITQDKNYYIGTQLAYEFVMKDQTGILQRRRAEKLSLSNIRNEFNAYLTKSETEIVEHISNVNEKYGEYIEVIDTLKNDKELLFTKWFETSKSDFEIFDTESKEKVINLEKAYQELLSLKKPAEYWNLRASTLKKEGWSAIHWLVGLILFACLSLYLLLWLTPEGMLLSFINNQASAIKWSIIYVTFIAFLTYGIRALNKVAFSSFHLARDAEEREQLTFVYLALIKDGSVDEKDRSLIMQSLFSRADTGLLKDDSSPTMPNDIAGKLFGK